MVPVLLLKYRKDEVFLVRFLSDNNEIDNVDLGCIRFRFPNDEPCNAGESAGREGVAKKGRRKKEDLFTEGNKRGGEEAKDGIDLGGGGPEKKKKKKGKGRMWDELMEEADKKTGPQLSREERKALAVWQRFVEMETQVLLLSSCSLVWWWSARKEVSRVVQMVC